MTKSSKIWSKYADIRHHQITSGADISMTRVIEPAMLSIIEAQGLVYERALDTGCGTGHFTDLLKEWAKLVVGVDPSKKSIEIAKRSFQSDRVRFYNMSLEKFSRRNAGKFDLVTANMVLMDVDDLGCFVSKISELQKEGSLFIASLTHPAFWPIYKKYDAKGFDYNEESKISTPFAISLKKDVNISTFHYHRPIYLYINTIISKGYRLQIIDEPWPNKDVMEMYPEKWSFPRFLLLSFVKQ